MRFGPSPHLRLLQNYVDPDFFLTGDIVSALNFSRTIMTRRNKGPRRQNRRQRKLPEAVDDATA